MSVDTTPFGPVTLTRDELAAIEAKLGCALAPQHISIRDNGKSGKIPYIAGDVVINLLNELYGSNGWTMTITKTDVWAAEKDGRHSATVVVEGQLRTASGAVRDDFGEGGVDSAWTQGSAIGQAHKEAVTDVIKRTAHQLGRLFNCVYDPVYRAYVLGQSRPTITFDPGHMYRMSSATVAYTTTTAADEPSRPVVSSIQPVSDRPYVYIIVCLCKVDLLGCHLSDLHILHRKRPRPNGDERYV